MSSTSDIGINGACIRLNFLLVLNCVRSWFAMYLWWICCWWCIICDPNVDVSVRISTFVDEGNCNCGCRYKKSNKGGKYYWKHYGLKDVQDKCAAKNYELLMNPEKWKENIETVNLMRVKTNLPIQKEKEWGSSLKKEEDRILASGYNDVYNILAKLDN